MKWPTPYFTRAEFACKCGCGFDTVDYGLVAALDKIRAHFGVPVTITSGCRCESHNRAVGGSEASQHRRGRAADFTVQGIPPSKVAEYVEGLGLGGIGIYKTWIHIDTRHGKARWDKR